jgi:hypothetical protein
MDMTAGTLSLRRISGRVARDPGVGDFLAKVDAVNLISS